MSCHKHFSRGGFLTIELLISLGIMAMMSVVALSANTAASGRMETENLAHLIALNIREAQAKSLAVAEASGGTFPGYGVHFDVGSPTSYVFFSDRGVVTGCTSTDCNSRYDANITGELVYTKVLGKGIRIGGICTGSSGSCSSPSVDIFFQRPRPDAAIRDASGTRVSQTQIIVRSPRAGVSRTVTVTEFGQISVQ